MVVPVEFREFVEKEIASGRYNSVDEIVADGLRLFQENRALLGELRADIRARVESLERGEGIVIEGDEALASFFDEIEAEVRAESGNGP